MRGFNPTVLFTLIIIPWFAAAQTDSHTVSVEQMYEDGLLSFGYMVRDRLYCGLFRTPRPDAEEMTEKWRNPWRNAQTPSPEDDTWESIPVDSTQKI